MGPNDGLVYRLTMCLLPRIAGKRLLVAGPGYKHLVEGDDKAAVELGRRVGRLALFLNATIIASASSSKRDEKKRTHSTLSEDVSMFENSSGGCSMFAE